MPEHYQIRVKGRMSSELLHDFEDFDTWVEPAETVLERELDQAALQGVIERLRMLGLELGEVRRVGPRKQSS